MPQWTRWGGLPHRGPARTDSGNWQVRAKRTPSTTSATPAQRKMAAGRRSIIALKTRRTPS
jgi:hypothetical protein